MNDRFTQRQKIASLKDERPLCSKVKDRFAQRLKTALLKGKRPLCSKTQF
jgi:hypothetical protein